MNDASFIVNRFPEHIWIEPTTRCNTRCKYCLHWYESFGEDMEFSLYEKIRDQILDHVKRVELIGYGEPLIAKHFWDMFHDCSRRDIEILTTTNGLLLLDEEKLPLIVRSLFTICLSLDGAHKETAEFARPFIKWEKMIEILELLKKYGDHAGVEKRFSLRFNFVAMKQNIGDLPDLVKLAAKYGASDIFVMTLGAELERNLVKGQGLFDSPELVSPAFLKALKLGRRLGIDLNLPPSFRSLVLAGKEQKRGAKGKILYLLRMLDMGLLYLRNKGFHAAWNRSMQIIRPPDKAGITFCPVPWDSAYIAVDGTVYPCCVLSSKLGNLKSQDWSEIWNGFLYQNLRRTIHGWNPTAGCRYCGLSCGINGGDEHYYNQYFSAYKKKDIPLNSLDIEFKQGFYELEYKEDGAPSHIWMAKRGEFRIRKSPGARFLRLLIISLIPGGNVNSGKAILNQGRDEYFDNTCEDINFPLYKIQGNWIDVALEMEREFRVQPDPRLLALPIKGVQFLS
ncbi:SPASM domain-containing protein [Candidatus Sumerlaeota bacterium]|nr:SPASM domain-containing protein [Candidatus Sumerlaeota bacterium]